MSKQANPTAIGGFVLAGLGLLVVATLIFGGSELLAKHERLVSYFPGSVKGLRTGANVLFRGVRIGFVEEIQLQGDIETAETMVQVIMRIDPSQYHVTHQGKLIEGPPDLDDLEPADLIEAGLRAQLGVESFVTGQLVVEFDFFPNSELALRGVDPPYQEMPTIPNNIEQMVLNVQRFVADIRENLDIKKIGEDIQAAVEGFRDLTTSEDLRSTLSGANRLINDDDTQQLASQLSATLADARTALQAVRKLMSDADSRIGPLVDEMGGAINKLDGTLAAAEATLRSAGDQLRGDTELSYQLIGTLQEVEGASRSLRVFLDYLERNPEALLRGKREQ